MQTLQYFHAHLRAAAQIIQQHNIPYGYTSLVILTHLALHPDDDCTIRELLAVCKIPHSYMNRITKEMSERGLVLRQLIGRRYHYRISPYALSILSD